jgi:hypothetical protein
MLIFFKIIIKKIISFIPLKYNFFFDSIAIPLFYKKKLRSLKYSMFDLYSFGNKNPNKIFYVIKRSPGAGLFSNVIYVLNHILIAKTHNFIPFVDMENFKTIYNEKKKINNSFNSWEYYFHKISKYSKEDIYNSKKVIISHNTFYKNFSHKIADNKTGKIADELLKIKKEYIFSANTFASKFFGKKTLGIHYRGTSYKTSANHPFPATKRQIVNACYKLIKKYKYDKIFLCTEDKLIFDELINKFNNKICFVKDSYRSYYDDAFRKYPRPNHRFRLGKEILIESIILSKCDGFLYANSNVSEFVKYLDKKKSIKYFKLSNGNNSSNPYIAKWLWFYKNSFPKILFGFDNKIKLK